MTIALCIRGCSDDLIEIEGDWRKEFYASESGNDLIFSDGTMVNIIYGRRGTWVLSLINEGNNLINHCFREVSKHCDYSEGVELVFHPAPMWVYKVNSEDMVMIK